MEESNMRITRILKTTLCLLLIISLFLSTLTAYAESPDERNDENYVIHEINININEIGNELIVGQTAIIETEHDTIYVTLLYESIPNMYELNSSGPVTSTRSYSVSSSNLGWIGNLGAKVIAAREGSWAGARGIFVGASAAWTSTGINIISPAFRADVLNTPWVNLTSVVTRHGTNIRVRVSVGATVSSNLAITWGQAFTTTLF